MATILYRYAQYKVYDTTDKANLSKYTDTAQVGSYAVEAIRWAMDHAQPGDVIVLCGKGHETYQEVNHVKHHMDEREIVAEYFA